MEVIGFLSGGLDSMLAAYLAKVKYGAFRGICFSYGQRADVEVEFAKSIAEKLGFNFELYKFGRFYKNMVSSGVTGGLKSAGYKRRAVPNTFVPGRNGVFIFLLTARAYELGIKDVILSFNADLGNHYPDATHSFVAAIKNSISLGFGSYFNFENPIENIGKTEIWLTLRDLDLLDFALKNTISCVRGVKNMNYWGMGCGSCDGCRRRRLAYDFAFGASY